MKNPVSVNLRAEKIVGKREPINGIILFSPAEEGYHCPVCKYEIWSEDERLDERLHWGEYNGFLWCEVCNKDYPSAICAVDVDKAIDIFLATVENAIARDRITSRVELQNEERGGRPIEARSCESQIPGAKK